MSIQSEINRLKQVISDAFTVIGNKGGTVPSSKVSGNLATAINSIPTGVTVQRVTGTITGGKTINCGFKPDLVSIKVPEAGEDGWFHPAAAFTEIGMDKDILQAEVMDGFYYFCLTRTNSGFTCDWISFFDFDFNASEVTGKYQFTAIKYT